MSIEYTIEFSFEKAKIKILNLLINKGNEKDIMEIIDIFRYSKINFIKILDKMDL
jgi:GTP-binding protein EngB required for normal cell division